MKKLILLSAFLMYLIALNAQIKSSHDGFYSADSVFYKLTGTGNFKYCVNCYSADSLRPYTGGIWLHSRQHAPNTWENSQFTKDMAADSIYIRPDVVKGNTIWVRVYNDTGYTDAHHFVFLGTWRPKATPVISLVIDSADFMGANGFYGPGEGIPENYRFRWNYLLKMEKSCSYQIYAGKDLSLQAEQNAGIEVSANYSAVHPDKAIQLNANRTSNKGGNLLLGKYITDTLGEKIKILRLRVGGANHRTNILSNEIALDIIEPSIGGEHSIPVCVFINGSFWTYSFAEEGLGPNHIMKYEKDVSRQQMLNIKVPVVVSIPQLEDNGIYFTRLNNSLYGACGYTNTCEVFYVYKDTLQFEVDTNDVAYNPEEINKLCQTVKNGTDKQIADLIDRDVFYRYAFSIWFFQNPEGWARRITLIKPGTKPWKIFAEHYDFEPKDGQLNDWNKYFANLFSPMHKQVKTTIPWQAAKRMLRYDTDNFCRVFEDELNTTYRTERVAELAQKKIASLRPCINECSQAWQPNDWIDSTKWEETVARITQFLQQRPQTIANALPKIFMTNADTLWTVKDMNTVWVVFDSVPGKDVIVKLNSLQLTSNFSGKYYPKPDLQIDLKYDAAKYQFIKWLEYQGAPASFKLSASKPVTLTPILKLKKTGHPKR